MNDYELAKKLLDSGTDLDNLLSNDEIVEKLNDPLFQRYMLKLMRARAFASLPSSLVKLIELAESGKETAIAMLFRLLNLDFKEVETRHLDKDELERRISELLKQRNS